MKSESEEKTARFRLPNLPITWLVLLCAVVLAVGISFVEIKQHQEQKNDQSQTVTQNAITKTVVVNIVDRNLKLKGVKWESRQIGTDNKDLYAFFNSGSLDAWQMMYAKYIWKSYGEANSGFYVVIYPTHTGTETTFTNTTKTSNSGHTVTTNVNEIENALFKRIKDWFGRR